MLSIGLLRKICLLLPLFLAGCSAISFALVNVPSHFTRTQRIADVAFGPETWQRLDIYEPARVNKDRPVIVFCYGGNWTAGSKDDYRFVGAALAARGYVVFVPNYRLYPAVRFPVFIEDVAAAVAWVQAHGAAYGGNPQRIVLMGHSAGAHIAAMLALNQRYLERAGADPSRIVGLIGLSGPYDLAPNTPMLDAIFAAPYTPADWQVTPFASPRAPPALLIQGGDDQLVSPSNSQHLAAELRSEGVPVRLRIFPDRGHADTVAALAWVLRWRAPTLQDVDDFMRSLGTGKS